MEELDDLEKYYVGLLTPDKPTYKRSERVDEWIAMLKMLTHAKLEKEEYRDAIY